MLGEESADKGVASRVGVDNLLCLQGSDWELLHLPVLGYYGGFRALGEDDKAAPGAILLGQLANPESNLSDILSVPRFRLCEGPGLSLVAEENINVRHRRHESSLERRNFHKEWCRQVHGERLVVLARVLGNGHDGFWRNSHEEASDVIESRLLDQSKVLRLLQVLDLVVVGRLQVGHEGSVVAGDNNPAGTSWRVWILHILDVHSILPAFGFHSIPELVLADAAHESGRSGNLKHPLRNSDCVLGSATGNVLDIAHASQFLVEGQVRLLGEDGIVCFDVVLRQEVRRHLRANVE
mmetsp:Transcript_4161/g.10687  ORF Transcript_4161/g.10687 Transcript_4161/m.10687 type:complete len:295 (+) Transcript_4161:2693-3577(+)